MTVVGIFTVYSECCCFYGCFSRNYQNRTVAMIENGSWMPTAVKVMTKMLEGAKNLTFTENNVKILSAMTEENKAQIRALAEELCK